MGTLVTVMADTQAEAEAQLAKLCALADLRPLAAGRAMTAPGRSRWMARAETTPEQSGER